MPRSKIIKELANGTVDTLIALKRTKVLLTEFDNVELNTWINNEITGYPKDAEIPAYRVVRGSLMGSYFKGSMASHMTWNHVCNGVQREHNKKLNNGLPILHKVPPKRDYGRYFCIMAEKGGTSHGGLTEKLSLFFHAKKQEVNAYGR